MERRKLAAWLTALVCVACLFFLLGSAYSRRSAGDTYVITAAGHYDARTDLATQEAAETPAAAENPAGTGETLNINTATAEQLQALPGIGEVLSQRIVAYRQAHGAFVSVADLLNVEGIGESKYAAIRDLICIQDGGK